MSISDAQLQQIADKLFLLKKPMPVKLSKPVNTAGATSLVSALDSVGKDARFKNAGIGVVDFTNDPANPRIWLHNGDDPWRIGSTGKIAILLAAVQLRDDVREVKELNFISTPEEFDGLFQMPQLWNKSPNSGIRQIAGKANAPRPSTIFDFTKTPVDFLGPDPDTPDRTAIALKLPGEHLTWEAAPSFAFSELLWLAGARSDNIAATACISEIGVDYLKAVQRAYGLYDDTHRIGMHLLLAGGYWTIDKGISVNNSANAPTYRQLQNEEHNPVKDGLYNQKTGDFDDRRSMEPGSAAALTAYMIALMKDELVDNDHESQRGITGCITIRNNLSKGGGEMTQSFIVNGVSPLATVSREITKIGLLGKEDGEPGPLDCEFAYLETEPAEVSGLKFGVVATGLKDINVTADLGAAIFRALLL